MSERFNVKEISDQIGNRIAPKPVKTLEVEVAVSMDSPVLHSYLDAFYKELGILSRNRGGNVAFSFDDFRKYIATIVKSRVGYVNGERGVTVFYNDDIRVPAFLSNVLENLGLVSIPSRALELRPVYTGEDPGVDLRWMKDISRELKHYEDFGMHFAIGYSRDKEGEQHFMTLQMMEDKVMAMSDEANPAYALLASTLALQGLAAVLGAVNFRTEYAEVSHLQSLVIKFAEASKR